MTKLATKRVVLEFDGSLATGFRVTLALGEEGQSARLRCKGNLPPAPELLAQLEHHWQENYRPLGAPYSRFWQDGESGLDFRIKPKKVMTKGPRQEQIETCHQSAHDLQQALNDWLLAPSFREIDRTLRQELSPQDSVRVLLHTNDLPLQKLPLEEWDFLDRYPKAVPSFSPLEAKTAVTLPPITSTGTVRILAILGHSAGIDVARDRALIEQLPYAEAVFLEQPTLKDISDRLWNESWDILFFAGHSETQGEQGIIHLSPTESLTIEQLWYNLRRAVDRGLQLAIFNSCDGLGLSQRLDDLHIPQMILMRELVPDRVAHQFLTHFLQEFAAGESLYGSVRQARQRLHDELEREIPCASWLPVICQNPLVLPPSWQQLAGLASESEPEPEPKPVSVPKSRPRRRSWRWRLAVSVLVAIAVIFVRSWGWLQPLEWWAYDAMLRSRPPEVADNRILLVEITDNDFEVYGLGKAEQGSIDDAHLYELLKKIEQHEPAAIGLQIWRDEPVDVRLPELQNHLRSREHIYGVCHAAAPGRPVPGIEGSKSISEHRLGFDNVVDDNGVIRRHLLLMDVSPTSRCLTNNALSLRLAEHYLQIHAPEHPIEFIEQKLRFGEQLIPRLQSHHGAYQALSIGAYQILLNYRNTSDVSNAVPTATLTDVLKGSVNDQSIRNRIVIIGVNRDDIHDRYQTPYGQATIAMLQAQMTSQLISHAISNRVLLKFLPKWQELGWLVFWITGISLLSLRFSRMWLLTGGITAVTLLSVQGLRLGYWIPFFPTLIGITVILLFMGYRPNTNIPNASKAFLHNLPNSKS